MSSEPSSAHGRRAVFLDRDGTIIAERHYISEPEQIELIEGAGSALQSLARAGFALVMVTNQSGIARGLFGVDKFRAVQERLTRLLQQDGVAFAGVFFCPHHPDFTGPCDCRKPAPGLYEQAARELGIDLGRSAYIGDRVKDVIPARLFGGLGILVKTGQGGQESLQAPAGVHVAADLGAAARVILSADQSFEPPFGPLAG